VAGWTRGVGKNLGRQVGAIELLTRIGFSSEVMDDLLPEQRVFVHNPFGLSVSIGDGDTQHLEDTRYGAFTRPDAAC
jgi:hypothetical protein